MMNAYYDEEEAYEAFHQGVSKKYQKIELTQEKRMIYIWKKYYCKNCKNDTIMYSVLQVTNIT